MNVFQQDMEYAIFYPVYSVAVLIFVIGGSKFLAYLSKRKALKKTGQLEIEKVRYLMAATEFFRGSSIPHDDLAIHNLSILLQREAERMHIERVRKNLI